MAITKNNFVLNQNYELASHEVTILIVDFVVSVAAEVNDCSDGTALGGLDLVRKTFEQQGLSILAEGPLVESGKQKNYMVRKDSIDALGGTLNGLQAAIRALDAAEDTHPNITATITSATVAEKELIVAV